MKSRFPHLVLFLALAGLVGCASIKPPQPGDTPAYRPTPPAAPVAPEFNSGAIYQPALAQNLFEDYKARRVGDILTVILNESTNAEKSTEASTSKGSDYAFDMGNINVVGYPLIGGGAALLGAESTAERNFEGAGDAKQSNLLEGQITVTVAEVLPNGNLVVQGEKWLGINQGKEYVRLRGIVRPVDITAANTVQSTQIANAEVYYGGTGTLADSSAPGWLTRFFNSPIFPF